MRQQAEKAFCSFYFPSINLPFISYIITMSAANEDALVLSFKLQDDIANDLRPEHEPILHRLVAEMDREDVRTSGFNLRIFPDVALTLSQWQFFLQSWYREETSKYIQLFGEAYRSSEFVQALEGVLSGRRLDHIYIDPSWMELTLTENSGRIADGEMVTRLCALSEKCHVLFFDTVEQYEANFVENLHSYLEGQQNLSVSSPCFSVSSSHIGALVEVDPFGTVSDLTVRMTDRNTLRNLVDAIRRSRIQKLTWEMVGGPYTISQGDLSLSLIQELKNAIISNEHLTSLKFDRIPWSSAGPDVLFTNAIIPALKVNHRITDLSLRNDWDRSNLAMSRHVLEHLPHMPGLRSVQCEWDPKFRVTFFEEVLPKCLHLETINFLPSGLQTRIAEPSEEDRESIRRILRSYQLMTRAKSFVQPRPPSDLAEVVFFMKTIHDEDHNVGFSAAHIMARGALPELLISQVLEKTADNNDNKRSIPELRVDVKEHSPGPASKRSRCAE